MLIFRLESIDNPHRGVFSNQIAWNASTVARSLGVVCPYRHPEPSEEPGILRSPFMDERCGFPSLDAYRTWFAHRFVRQELYRDGSTHMRVYDVPDDKIAVGMLQVLFKIEDAISVRVATPEEMA